MDNRKFLKRKATSSDDSLSWKITEKISQDKDEDIKMSVQIGITKEQNKVD